MALESDHFGALAGPGSIFIDFLLNSDEKPTILGPWLARARFSLISIKFLLETGHFGAQAGRGSIFIDFLLDPY